MAKQKFKTEVSQLLHLIIHSLYSNKEIFIRELVSNSSDALDKLRYLQLTDPLFKKVDFSPKIDIHFEDTDNNKTLTISDTGIGMDKDDLIASLGTIARSGTKNFMEKLTGDSKKDSNLIGQFGVGFYSCFMVADRVEVHTRKANDNTGYLWKSDGKTGFTIKEMDKEEFGTEVKVFLNDEGNEFANRWSIDSIVKKYSNHIAFPIFIHYLDKKDDKEEQKVDQINSASAFWKQPKSSLKKKDYNEFYKTIGNDYQDPLMHMHTNAEGTLEYTTLFYVPSTAPFDLYQADYKPGVKLYVNRVFITDDDKELMPTYLRFIKGIIDSEDLPLNVSREILQKNKILSKIKSNSVKKILDSFVKLANKDDKKYMEFYSMYGRPIKEGLYQDFENRETLFELVRYKSSMHDDYVTLKDYADRMKKGQESIFYLSGDNLNAMKNSPLLESCIKKGIEVLLMDDEIDEIVLSNASKYKEFQFKSINQSGALDEFDDEAEDSKKTTKLDPLVKKIKSVLGDKVKDVIISGRLTDSPTCIVSDSSDPTAQMQNIMKQMGQMNIPDSKPILEINPNNKIIKKLAPMSKNKQFKDTVMLLFEQAMIIENMKLDDPSDFVSRVNRTLEKAL